MDDDREEEIKTARGLQPVLTVTGLLALGAAFFASGGLTAAMGIIGIVSLGGAIVAGLACDDSDGFERDCQASERQPIDPAGSNAISQKRGMPEREISWVASLDRSKQVRRNR